MQITYDVRSMIYTLICIQLRTRAKHAWSLWAQAGINAHEESYLTNKTSDSMSRKDTLLVLRINFHSYSSRGGTTFSGSALLICIASLIFTNIHCGKMMP